MSARPILPSAEVYRWRGRAYATAEAAESARAAEHRPDPLTRGMGYRPSRACHCRRCERYYR